MTKRRSARRARWVAAVVVAITTLVTVAPWRTATGHEPEPSHEQTLAAVAERLTRTLDSRQIVGLEAKDVPALLTEHERERLSRDHVSFHVNVPAVVWLMCESTAAGEPFWLEMRGFERTGQQVKVGRKVFDIWRRQFEAGHVNLGIGSFDPDPYPYFLALQPRDKGNTLKVTELDPGRLRQGILNVGTEPFVDRDAKVVSLPAELDGRILVRTSRRLTQDRSMLGWFRATEHPSSDRPDHVVLTWSGDPRTTQTIQWRTSLAIAEAVVRYRRAGDEADVLVANGRTEVLYTPYVVNDSRIQLHSATLMGLAPATTYEFSVGDGEEGHWSAWRSFTTAPDGPASFSFVYMGDAQNGLAEWGRLLHDAHHEHPGAGFHILAGDLVDRGSNRDNWDEFFHHAQGIYDQKAFVPALGNHEYLGEQGPELYLRFFDLPENGPSTIEKEKSYSFTYGDAFFVVLDSNEDPELQSDWLDEQFGNSDATWKFAIFHHPVYASHPDRDHSRLLREWGPIFDKHRVAMVLQGHDHGYLRTYPMRANERVSPLEGTYYVVSVSGRKFYPQALRDYAEVGFTETPTYQLIEIDAEAGTLRYRAFDTKGELRDEINLTKPAAVAAPAATGTGD